MSSHTTPSTVVTRSTEKVTLYAVDSGASMGRIGVMIRVQIEPTTASRKILVWMRPFRVGSTGVSLGRSGAREEWRGAAGGRRQIGFFRDPLPPLAGRAAGTELLGEALRDEVVGDLLRGDLQPEEGVHPREGAAEGRAARGVHPAVAVAGAGDLETVLDVEPADRVAGGAGVVEQVGEHAVLADVGLQAGAVDDVVEGADLRALVAGDADLD